VDLFKRSGGNGPGKAELREAMELADADSLRVKPGEISFAKSGMRLTLDGIAKGYVVDKASEALTAMGVHNHLINAGGDIRCSGERGSGRPWTVAVQDPRKQGNYPDVLRVRNCAMATSGNYEVSPDDGEPRRHLVSPETGLFPDALASATVTAPTVMEADALSTSLGVMRLDKGLEFIYSLPGRDCLVIAPSGETVRSRGWNSGA
jgi:thiamine biosynthesis lipoprotein